jgi:YaiO family outer membrane protein
LKPPRDALEAVALAPAVESEHGLDWRNAATREDLAPRLTLYSGSAETRRFATRNLAYRSTMYRPDGLAGMAETPFDPRFSGNPRYSLVTQATHALADGWGVGFGLRQTDYGFATTNLLAVSAERYFGNVRGAYTVYSNAATGGSTAAAHRFQVNYFYGERNVVGLAYTTGRDMEHFTIPAVGLPVNDVRDLTLSGRHWLSTNWALTYDVLSQEQSVLSTRRQGLRLGVSRSF